MQAEGYLSQIDLESELIAFTIIAVALAIIVYLNRGRLQLRLREWRTRRCLDQIGSDQIRHLVCADGLDGFYDIDRLALAGDAILVIAHKPYGGNIYCAERISEWTQVIGQKSFKFENPLFELENQLTALRTIVGNVNLCGYLFFDYSADFPKGHPASVLQPGNIPDRFLRSNCAPADADIAAAWEQLKAHQNGASASSRVSVNT